MKPRRLYNTLKEVASYYPVVSLTGPRQSGKSTLVRGAFPDLRRYSLEAPDIRSYARQDPRGFIEEIRAGAILDEVQHVPELLSFLQEEVDRDPTPGRFILTGSEHLSISLRVAQSLAGRSGILHLLTLSLEEWRRLRAPSAPSWRYSGPGAAHFRHRDPPGAMALGLHHKLRPTRCTATAQHF